MFDLENHAGTPIYVHAKVCVIDDVWACAGSANLNRRSWSHDRELSCAVLDDTRDEREPRDPAGLGDGARRFARDLRLRLLREHLDRGRGDDADLLDPDDAVAGRDRGRGRRWTPGTAVAGSARGRPDGCVRTGPKAAGRGRGCGRYRPTGSCTTRTGGRCGTACTGGGEGRVRPIGVDGGRRMSAGHVQASAA